MTRSDARVEIYESPKYVGGSGPLMAPITLLPEDDDNSWTISQLINYPIIPHYVVHPRGSPVIRKIVRKSDILDWVSPRVLEAFEFEEEKTRETQEEEQEQKRNQLKLTKNGKKKGRPFKNPNTGAWISAAESIETETDIPDVNIRHLASSQPFKQPSLSQPSLSEHTLSLQNLSLKRKMESLFNNGAESTEDEERLESMESPRSKRSRTGMSEGSTRKTPRNLYESFSRVQMVLNPAPIPLQYQRSKPTAGPATAPDDMLTHSKPRTPQRHTTIPLPSSNSNQRPLGDRSSQPFYGCKPQAGSGANSPSPPTTQTKNRPSTTPARYPTRSSSVIRIGSPVLSPPKPANKVEKAVSSKRTTPTSQQQSRATTRSRSKSAPVTPRDRKQGSGNKEQGSGKRWKVIKLLNDRWQRHKQRRVHYYLIEWAGGYKPTWERAINITEDLKQQYENRKIRRAETHNKAPAANDANEFDELGESPVSNSSADAQAEASRQLYNDTSGLLYSEDELGADEGDVQVAVKREASEESPAEWPLKQGYTRSPYFPDPSPDAFESEF